MSNHKMELEIRQCMLYKFHDQNFNTVQVYIDHICENSARTVININGRLYRRYWDGCGPSGIRNFFIKNTAEGIYYGHVDHNINVAEEYISECDKEYGKHLKEKEKFQLELFLAAWPLLIEQFKKEI